jgi:hypothetical protein
MVDGHLAPVELARRALRLERPEEGLRAVAELRRHLEELEELHVVNAREEGWSWNRIAYQLGVSKQALHKKHAGRVRPRIVRTVPPPVGRQLVITGAARRCVRVARQEAAALRHGLVGSGHLLLGVLRAPETIAAAALAAEGVSLDAARIEVDRLVTRIVAAAGGSASRGRGLPISRAARRALEQSLREAVRLRDDSLRPEHILRALLRDHGSVAAQALAALEVEPTAVRRRLRADRRGRNVRPRA